MTRKKFHQLLITLRTRVNAGEFPAGNEFGICANLCELTPDDFVILMEKYQTSWKWFSGDYRFPVPACEGNLSARNAYDENYNKWTGEYGKLRMSLLNHLIRVTR